MALNGLLFIIYESLIYIYIYAYSPGLFQSHTIKNAIPWKKAHSRANIDQANNTPFNTFQYNEPSSPTLVDVGQSIYAFLKHTHTQLRNCVWCSVSVWNRTSSQNRNEGRKKSIQMQKWKAERNDQEMQWPSPYWKSIIHREYIYIYNGFFSMMPTNTDRQLTAAPITKHPMQWAYLKCAFKNEWPLSNDKSWSRINCCFIFHHTGVLLQIAECLIQLCVCILNVQLIHSVH